MKGCILFFFAAARWFGFVFQVTASVARFFLVQHTKTGENIPNDHKMARK
jgi:hypothetical protein